MENKIKTHQQNFKIKQQNLMLNIVNKTYNNLLPGKIYLKSLPPLNIRFT